MSSLARRPFISAGETAPKSVIGDQDGAGALRDFLGFLCDCICGGRGKGGLRLAIHAEDLLLGGVGPSCEVTRFGRCDPIAGAEDAGDVDVFAAEMVEQLAATGVVTDYAYREDAGAEVSQVEDGVGGAAGIRFGAAMTDDQDRGFAGDAGNFAGDEFVEDEIAYYGDGLAREAGDDVEEAGQVHGGVGFVRDAGGRFEWRGLFALLA